MKTSHFNVAGLLMALTLVSPICHAESMGGSDGGGGDVVLCYSSETAKQAVQHNLGSGGSESFEQEVDLRLGDLAARPTMLEIFENEGMKAEKNIAAQPFADLFPNEQEFLKNLMIGDDQFFRNYAKFVSASSQWQSKRNGVTEINDSSSVARIPKSCLLVQVAFYDDTTDAINFDTRLFELMNPRNRMALKIHEDLYKMWRTLAKNNEYALDHLFNSIALGPTDEDKKMYEYLKNRYATVHTSNIIRPLSYSLSRESGIFFEAVKLYGRNVVQIEAEEPNRIAGKIKVKNKLNNDVIAVKGADYSAQRDGQWTLLVK
jgi:hypothetical protein